MSSVRLPPTKWPLRESRGDFIRLPWLRHDVPRHPRSGRWLSKSEVGCEGTRVFHVSRNILRAFNKDLKAAGIDKRDERGRTVDVHALRTSFGTHLSKGGAPLRTAQAAMRHSDPSLTANVYTDPRLLDVAGALNVLPSLPLDGGPDVETVAMTGTDAADSLAPNLAPNADNRGDFESSADKTASDSTGDP